MFQNLAMDDSIQQEKDVLGGGGALATDIYPGIITMAYVTTAKSGAMAVSIAAKLPEQDREYRETLYVTSGTAKGCKNYYEVNGEKRYLPGFAIFNSICELTVGKQASQMATEKKVVKRYSPEAKGEAAMETEVLVDLLNKPIFLALFNKKENKTVKNEATGKYEPTAETYNKNEIAKVFRASDKMTSAEIKANAESADFFTQWKDKWAGQELDRTVEVAKTPTAGAPTFAAPAATQATEAIDDSKPLFAE